MEELYNGQHVTNETIYHSWWENQSFVMLYERNQQIRDQTLLIKQRQINAYVPGMNCTEDWSEGDFIIHFPGMSNEARNSLTDQYLKKVLYD